MAGNKQKFHEAMNQGHSAAWDQLWEKAAEHYRVALSEFADDPDALASVALAMYELEDFDNALVYYKKTAEAAPDDPIPMDKIAHIQEHLGLLPEAIQSFLKAAELYVKTREIEKAIACWNRVILIKPDHLNARTRLAMIHERRGKKIEAVDEYLATASIMQRQGDVRRAAQIVEYCLKIGPEHPKAINALALLRSNQALPKPGRPHGSSSPIRAAQENKSRPSVNDEANTRTPVQDASHKALIRAAALLFDQADFASENQTAKRNAQSDVPYDSGVLVKNPKQVNKALMHLGLAVDAQTRNDDNQTLAELEKTLETGLTHPAIHFLVGQIYANKEPEKALKHLKIALSHPNFIPGAYLLLGRSCFNAGNLQEAAASYIRALAIMDSSTVPADKADDLRQLYEPVIESQMHQEDEESLRKFCQNIEDQLNRADWREYLISLRNHLPDAVEGKYLPLSDLLLSSSSNVLDAMTRIRELASKNYPYSALEEAFYALDEAPTFLPLHILIGELLLQQGKTLEAANKFTLVADLYQLRGETTQALRMLERITRMAPMNLKIRSHFADMLVGQRQIIPAVEQLKQIADIYYKLAELDKAQQTYVNAIRLVQRTNKNSSVVLDLLYRKADIDMQRLDFRQAGQVFEQILEIAPLDIKGRVGLINLYFRLGQDSNAMAELNNFTNLLENEKNHQGILEFLQALVSEVPDKLEIRKRLADHLLKQGKKQEGVEQLDMIADALLNMGNREAALRVLQIIISHQPANVSDYQDAYNQLSSN